MPGVVLLPPTVPAGKLTMRPSSSEYMRMDQPRLPSEAEGHAGVIGRDAGREGDAAEVRDGVLILAVVVHHPDFFGAGARADEVDLGFGDAVDAAAEAEDDLVGEAVRDGARHVFAGGFVVLLAEHLGIGGVAGVVEPAVDDQAAVGGRERAEGDHGGVGGLGGPLREVDLLRRAGRGLRAMLFETMSKMPAFCEVAEEGGVEGGFERGRLRVGADRLEVRGGQADARLAEIGAGVHPILREGGKRSE